MSRSFTADFLAQTEADASRPYFVLGINWGTSVVPIWRYYLDRSASEFVATGERVPAGVITTAFVTDWGENPMALKEQQVNSVESRTIKLEDTEGHIRSMFSATPRQQKGVLIYRMFDDDSVTFSADAQVVFAGSILPLNWTETDCIATITLEDASRRFFPDVGLYATQEVFGDFLPRESRDQMMPICWGKVHRVKALRVAGPYETKTRTSFSADSGDVTIDIDDHPSELGITSLGSSGSPIPVFIGPDKVTGYFLESGSPDDTPSTFTIKAGVAITIASATIEMVVGTSTRDAYIRATSIRPENMQQVLLDQVVVGDDVRVFVFDPTNDWIETTITVLERDDPWPGWYRMRFASSTAQANMAPGSMIHFLHQSVARRGWQAGVTITPYNSNSIYIANAFASHGVLLVEGFGNVWDMNGESRKDFVKIGKSFNEGLAGTVPFEETDYDNFTVNLDDSQWNYTGTGSEGTSIDLGRNVTTITMPALPRSMNPDLDTNEIWVTLLGTPEDLDPLNDEIRNPALVILQYLESEYLFGLDASNIDYPSFTAATTALAGYFVGWAQIKPMKGLELLQEIARQCHCIILLDGDAVQIVVLLNSSATAALTFDTGSNQSPPGALDNIKAGTLELAESSIVDIVTNIVGRWTKYWDDKTGKEPFNVQGINPGALERFDRKERDFAINLFWRRGDVETEVDFWLTRESRIYENVKFTGYHDALKLLPGDWIKVTYWSGLSGAIDSGTDLEAETDESVSSVTHTFTGDDVGRKLVITAGSGWTTGDYTIVSVATGIATLDRSPATMGELNGTWSLREATDVILQDRYCEIVSVTDKGLDGEVEIACRFAKFVF